MKIRIINPVPDISQAVSEEMKAYIEPALMPDTELEFVNVKRGFRSIETETQGIINGAEILFTVMESLNDGWDGIFINCFDDPAVTAAREMAQIPVLGPYAASVHFAALTGEQVGIITTDDYGFACERRKAAAHGTAAIISAVEKADMTVLSLREGNLLDRLSACCRNFAEKGIYAVVLGCTGMNFVAEDLQKRLCEEGSPVRIIEPLKTGVKMLETMIALGHTNRIKSTPISMEEYIG